MTDQATPAARDYSKTLFLPQTDFPMRAGLPEAEPKLLARWQKNDLYRQLRSSAAGRPKFVLHDGPPYANGNIHIGHALNKILKDIITRAKQMLGNDSNYVPGWDCHGLPIEWKIEEQYRAKGKNKDEVPVVEFRKECRAFADHWLNVQREEFKRLGVTGDWDHPYSTMAYSAEAQIAREIMKFAVSDQLYRGSKPVMWSVVEKTALAEAEVEYEDHVSDTVYVAFPVIDYPSSSLMLSQSESEIENAGGTVLPSLQDGLDSYNAFNDCFVVIWTTTPWTIPGNRAISYSSKIPYSVYKIEDADPDNWAKVGNKFILADRLAEEVMKAARVKAFKRVRGLDASDLRQISCAHPLAWKEGVYRDEFPHSEYRLTRVEGALKGQVLDGHILVLPDVSAEKYINSVFAGSTYERLGPYEIKENEKYFSPLPNRQKAYDFQVPLLDGDHVTDDAGTGFVHTAPGHGREDFDIWMASGKMLAERGIATKIPYTVDADGFYTDEAPGFTGKRVITDKGEKGDANDAVIKALIEAGNLVSRGRLKHQYPHSWRSKKPVIFRNTPQWFIAMDKKLQKFGDATLRDVALKSIKATEWVPASGENRITGMIANRPDWVVSRQRAWGVPICVFVCKEDHGNHKRGDVLKDEKLNAAIADAFEKDGADAWFADDGARFLKPFGYDTAKWEKVNDVLDVWFDSGSTHAFTLNNDNFPGLKNIRRAFEGGEDKVMYLEGTDQHRGWFHSSLLESCGTRGRAPYDVVLTHGFVLDPNGKKMSKSLGNVVAPQDVIKQSGADILRLWVAASDYSDDLRLGKEIIGTFVETYRKLRNTMRWMLGTLAHYDAKDAVPFEKMPELEKLMLHRLHELDQEIRPAMAEYDYKRVISVLSQFMTADLSAFYFDIRKDTLYCDPPSSLARKASLTCIEQIFRAVTLWLAPILTFTAEEAWLAHYPSDTDSVHLHLFPDVPADWQNDALALKWKTVRHIRRVVTGALEIERANKRMGSSLEAAPVVYIADDAMRAAVDGIDFAEICITSDIRIVAGEGPAEAFRMDEVKGVAVVPQKADGVKCARSWKYFDPATADPAYPDVTPRDAQALKEWDAGRAA